jgi:quinol-cytochrome oxidoreductase complex cytochrome b subunit
MMILHVFRVYLTGGFKKPRELTWVTGVVLRSKTLLLLGGCGHFFLLSLFYSIS